VQNWQRLLEDLYVIFSLTPWHRNVARAKEVQRRCDVEGEEPGLHCIRNKDGHEVDFLVTRNKRPHLMLEVIWSDNNLSPNFRKLLPKAPEEAVPCIQIVGELERAKSFPTGERVMAAQEFLEDLTALDVRVGT